MVTTLARPTTKNNPPAIPSHVTELQFNYGVSCSKYEQLAEKKLAKSSTIIVSGIGCTLKVKRNALAIFPGLTHAAQALETRMLYRGVHGVTHIIFITDKGLFTLDALKWCSDQDVSVCMMDSRGNI